MSQSWKYTAIEKLSAAKHTAMKRDLFIEDKEHVASYDNLNIRMNKMEQRLDNKSITDSGTAATVYVIEKQELPSPSPTAYRALWEEQSRNPITAFQILERESDAAVRTIRTFNKWRVLDVLLNSGKFNRELYHFDKDPVFSRPAAIEQLPRGKEYVLTQYMLDTAHIEEVSLEGNLRCLDEWTRQLGLADVEKRKKLSHEKLFFWMGDQLTVSRIRSLQKTRARELNCWHRLENIISCFGWLHAQMALEESIHRQHFATGTGGLKHAFDLLQRKGLQSAATQGNFHQRVREAYYHILEAHIRNVWTVVGEVNDLAELRTRSPEELDALADKIVDEFASTGAYLQHKRKPKKKQDHVLMNQILCIRDLLDYVNLDDAISTGDIGRVLDLLPRILFRYHSGKNWKYVIEVLEFLQGLDKEWPVDLRCVHLALCSHTYIPLILM